MENEKLVYHFNIMRQYNSVTRGERVNMGVQVKDINTGRCMQKIRKDAECMIGISPDMTPEYAHAILPFFGKDGEWQEQPGGFEHFNRDGGTGRAMACNQTEKGGVGLGHMQRGCPNPKDLRTLEACLDDIFERYCTPYRLKGAGND